MKPRGRWRLRALAGAAALVGVASPADAHLVTTGLGPVYDGVGHLLLTPEDLLPVVALSLLAGLRGPASGRWALGLLPVAWLAGGFAGALVGGAVGFRAAAVSFLVLGALVALDIALPTSLVGALAVALGLLHGFFNGAALAAAGAPKAGLAGIAATIFVLVALISAAVVAVRPVWTRIAVRVAGSWIAAVGLLMLGWAMRKPG